ncbi:CAP domain-containing protein [Streptomyces sp. NPDC048639]|uniref:CAP domain-containing protein n=1 Tax=Streptomyces sp. NPDC048639 TaxID=3365581 RepID=UPI003713B84C
MSPRHGNGRRIASHRRRREGQPVRRIALTAGILTVVAGVGTGVAVVQSGGDPVADASTADRAASSASPMAEEAVPRTSSGSPSKSKSSTPKRKKTSTKASPRRTAEQQAKKRTTETAADRSSKETTRSAPAPRTSTPAATGDAARIVQLVNQERAQAGCSPLKANTKLNAAAQKFTDAMARAGNLSHTGPDGSQVQDRVEREGYAWSAVGENIAQGQNSPEEVMKSWMNSQGHRDNILNCSFREIGIGINEGNNGPWWTQDFGTSR